MLNYTISSALRKEYNPPVSERVSDRGDVLEDNVLTQGWLERPREASFSSGEKKLLMIKIEIYRNVM